MNQTILQQIRNIFQTLDGFVVMVAGTEAMFDSLDHVFSPIPRFFRRVVVDNFETSLQTRECLELPLKGRKMTIPDAIVTDVHRITGGNPYEINLVGHFLFEECREGTTNEFAISPAVLDRIVVVLDDLRDQSHEGIARIRQLQPHQLALLQGIVANPIARRDWLPYLVALYNLPANPIDLENLMSVISGTISDFLQLGLIREEEGIVQLVGDQVDQIYLKYKLESLSIKVPELVHRVTSPMDLAGRITAFILEPFEDYMTDATFAYNYFDNTEGEIHSFGRRMKIKSGEAAIMISYEDMQRPSRITSQSTRFRVSVGWAELSFNQWVRVQSRQEKKDLLRRIHGLVPSLELLGIHITRKEEHYWSQRGAKEFDQNQNHKKALQCFERALTINPSFLFALANKANCLHRLKKFDEALDLVDDLLSRRPEWWILHRLKGQILIDTQQNTEAVAVLERALELEQNEFLTLDFLGRAFLNLGQWEKALEYFDRSLEQNENNPQAVRYKLHALIRLNDATALQEFSSHLNSESEELYLFSKIVASRLEGRPGVALAFLAKARKGGYHHVAFQEQKVVAHLDSEEWSKALKICDEMLEVGFDIEDLDQFFVIGREHDHFVGAFHLLKGHSLVGLGRKKKAVESLDQLCEILPEWRKQLKKEGFEGLTKKDLGSLF